MIFAAFFTDMTFTHEGNKTFIDNMVNFEKMVSSFDIKKSDKYFSDCIKVPSVQT